MTESTARMRDARAIAWVSACVSRGRTAAQLVMGVLRELSDESAYARFLAKHGRTHSATTWREFSDERFREKYVRPKCC